MSIHSVSFLLVGVKLFFSSYYSCKPWLPNYDISYVKAYFTVYFKGNIAKKPNIEQIIK